MTSLFPSYVSFDSVKYYKKTKRMIIYITSKEFIKQEIIDEKNSVIKELFSIQEVQFVPKYNINFDNIDKLNQYSNILRVKINQLFPATKKLNGNLKINYIESEKKYEVSIDKSIVYNSLIQKNAKKY